MPTPIDPIPDENMPSLHSLNPVAGSEPSTASAGSLANRRVRSFVVRAGRMGSGQQRAIQTLGPSRMVPFQHSPANWNECFGREAPLVLEVGFGMGQATAEIAQAHPDTNYLAIEVHPPGVGALLQRMQEMALSNIRIIQHDAVEVLTQMVSADSLDGIHIFFPDPWHKKRHHKRRLIQPALVNLLASRLKTGGTVHCATDWEPYAHQMLEVLGSCPMLHNLHEGFAPRPAYRPLTKFEARGLKLGHGVWDLVFAR
jgi:tRNA (guanine-N7-)-methyltransferase